jgi:predicted alpha/beta-fold hydrolase
MRGTAEKAWNAGFNVIRLNQRTCGGTDHLTPTLYHSGRSADIRAVLLELIDNDRLPEIFVAGFSMGGNLVLKMAGEFSDAVPRALRAFLAVAPAINLAACADSLEESRNFLYRRHFVRKLKCHMKYKASLFPKVYPPAHVNELLDGRNGRPRVRTLREFDDAITARFCDYYARSSARPVIAAIRRTSWILAAEDDPIVPFSIFNDSAVLENPHISFVATRRGGHCAFISQDGGVGRFWAETRLVEFCCEKSEVPLRL